MNELEIKSKNSHPADEERPKRKVSRRVLISELLGAAGAIALTACDEQGGVHPFGSRKLMNDPITPISGCSIIFETMAQMRASGFGSTIVDGMYAQLSGYHNENDGGGGLFYFAANENLPDDGGTVIKQSDNTTGCWVRIYEGNVNVKWFGAEGGNKPASYDANLNSYRTDYNAIQRAINAVSTQGGGVAYVPTGTYSMCAMLICRNNVTLMLAEGAIIRRNCNVGTDWEGVGHSMLIGRNSTSSELTNFSIRGGTFDGNGQNFPAADINNVNANGFNIFGGRNFTNLNIENTTFLDVVNCHSIDIAASRNVSIRKCNFLGYKNYFPSPSDRSRHFSESIQIDPDEMGNGDGTQCSNIIVEGCFFGPNPNGFPDAPACGIGNHAGHVNAGNFHNNISIINNTFQEASYAGIHVINMNNVGIQRNTFKNCDIGVFSDTSWRNPESNTGLTIDSNIFLNSARSHICFRNHRANNPSSDYAPFRSQSAKHKNITVANNKFNISEPEDTEIYQSPNAPGIWLSWCSNVAITGNLAKNVSNLVKSEYSNDIAISSNNCTASSSCALYLYESLSAPVEQDLHQNISIQSNNFSNWKNHRAIHVNAKIASVTISHNIFNRAANSTGSHAIQVDSGATKIAIAHNHFTDFVNASCIYLSGVQKATIIGNFAKDVKGLLQSHNTDGIDVSQNTCIYARSTVVWFASGGVGSIVVNDNRFTNWYRAIHVNTNIENITISNNTFDRLPSSVPSSDAIAADSGARNIVIFSNTIIGNSSWTRYAVYLSGSTQKAIVAHNSSSHEYLINSSEKTVVNNA